MAKRHDTPTPLKRKEVEEKSDRALAIVSVIGLVLCTLINANWPNSVPDIVFWILGLSITKDALKLSGYRK